MNSQSSYDFSPPALTTMSQSCSTNVMRPGVPNNASIGFGMWDAPSLGDRLDVSNCATDIRSLEETSGALY